MIRKFLTATAAMAFVSTVASAADLPARRAPPVFVPPPIAVPYSWTGIEFGLTTSYSFSGNKSVATTPFGGAFGHSGTRSLSRSGFDTVGGGIAANYQFTPGSGIVVGAAVDVNYLNLRKLVADYGPQGFTGDYQQRLSYLGTANGRIGYAIDRFMVYGIGGFAFAGLHDSAYLLVPGNPSPFLGTNGKIATGYDFGGGIDYAIPADSILNYLSVEKLLGFDKTLGLDIFAPTLKAEFVHYDLGTRTVLAVNNAGAPGGFVNRFRTEGNIVRFGLGYKFSGTSAAAPVVARY